MVKKRQSKYKTLPKDLSPSSVNFCLDHVLRHLEEVKANNGGKMPYGAVTSKHKEMKPLFPWLTIDMIKYHMKRKKREESDQNVILGLSQGDGEMTSGLSPNTINCPATTRTSDSSSNRNRTTTSNH